MLEDLNILVTKISSMAIIVDHRSIYKIKIEVLKETIPTGGVAIN